MKTDNMSSTHTLIVPEEYHKKRIDAYLGKTIEDISRSQATSLINDGHVTLNGKTISDPSHKIKQGDALEMTVPEAVDLEVVAENIPLDILFEDDDLVVVNKPAGLVVHPAPGNESGTLVNALLYHCGDSLSGIGGVKRPGIVHRLDKDTSGVMVVAKSDAAHQGLSQQFAEHTLDRRYKAVVWGRMMPPNSTVTGNIGRHKTNRKKMAVLPHNGKEATTHYRVLKFFGAYACLIECKLETGRTHQIRVHMTHIGHGLIGDSVYGKPRKAPLKEIGGDAAKTIKTFPRQALHAYKLAFTHPVTEEELSFETPLPSDMEELVKRLG